MAKLKTTKNNASVDDYIEAVEDERQRADCRAIDAMMRGVTGDKPAMWGASIVGYGEYTYQYASGRTGEWPLTGFAARKHNLTLYVMSGFDAYDELLAKLGKFMTGKGCLYINKLADVDQDALRELVAASVEHMRVTQGAHDR